MARLSRSTFAGRRQASRAALAATNLPVCSVLPAISGDLYQGETLTCSTGTWSKTPDIFRYQWRRDGAAIIGATAATRVLALVDVLAAMSCTVTAINLGVPAVATSLATEAVLGDAVFTVDPSISGTVQEGFTLTGDDGTHSGTSTTFRWLADDVAIGGETAATFVPLVGHIGALITFEVTAINDAGSAVATSPATIAVVAATVPINTVLPSITGTAAIGSTLTAASGTWTGAPTPVLTRQWLADAVPIGGATAATHVIVDDDLDKVITVTITGTNVNSAVDATSAATAAVVATIPINTVLPSISGVAQVGQTLTAADGTWTGGPAPVLTRQWLADAAPIGGATASTYLVDIGDLNKVITVTVTGTNDHSAVGATSAATAAVIEATIPVNTVLPSITGTAQEGQTLTAADGTWTGAPTPVLTRQWLADAAPIGGATAATYVPVVGDVTKVITVTVTGTNAHSAVDATSAATEAVIAA